MAADAAVAFPVTADTRVALALGWSDAELAHAMGNALSASNAFFATYGPVNLATVRSVMEACCRGRHMLRGAP